MNDRIGIDYNAIAAAVYQRRCEDAARFEEAARDEAFALAADIAEHGLEAADDLVRDWIADPAAALAELVSIAGRTASSDKEVGQQVRAWLTLIIEHAAMARAARGEGWR